MIRGEVNRNTEAVIRIEVFGPSSLLRKVDAVVDTGFSDYLSLPIEIVTFLGLPFRETETYALADDTDVDLDVYACTVSWDGRRRRAFAVAADGGVLIGMSLVRGHRLTIDVVDGGPVTIESLQV